MSVVKICWSGGKDSTCSTLLHLENGDFVKVCSYIPMFTDDIPLITKEHYDFILSASERFKSYGAEVFIGSGMTYFDFVTHVTTRGINKGKIFGFPLPFAGMCLFKNYSKVAFLSKLDVGYFDYMDIGIAYDEPKRWSQLSDFKRSILVEKHFTESMAFSKCLEYSLISPHYKYEKRDGCALCPNAPRARRERWFSDFPQAIPIVEYLQDLVKINRPDRFPLRGGAYFL